MTRSWLLRRHGLAVEAGFVVARSAVYQTIRGLVTGSRAAAVQHARDVATAERALHLFVESRVQQAVERIPILVGTLDYAYLSLHLVITGAVLLWLHQRQRQSYAAVRTA